MRPGGPSMVHVTRFLTLAACVLALGAAPDFARADELDTAMKRANKKLTSRLVSITKWAAGKRISGFRHRTFELILTIDPDHARARGVLGFKRKGKDGPWVKKKGVSEPPDWAVNLVPKGEEKIKKALTSYREDVITALDMDPAPNPARHEAIMETLVDLLPDDAVLRERNGDVFFEGRWVLPETASAIKRRKELRALGRELTKKAFLHVVEDPKIISNNWRSAWKSDQRWVFGVVHHDESRDIISSMEAAAGICAHLFGEPEDPLGPLQTIVLTDRDQAREIVSRNPKWRTTLAELDMVSGLHLPTGEYMVYRSNRAKRRTGPVRQVIQSGLRRRFPGKSRGWITEGIGQRLTWYTTGFHGPFMVSLARTERLTVDEEEPELPDSARAWPRAAAKVLTKEGPRCVAAVLTKRLNAMRASDILVAYGLAAFLIETRPKQFVKFAEATKAGHDAEEIVRTTLGADDVAMLTRRLRRWLMEY